MSPSRKPSRDVKTPVPPRRRGVAFWLGVAALLHAELTLVVGVGIYFFRRWIKTDNGRMVWDRFKLRMPVFGLLTRKTALARFSRTLAALTRSGVGILEALDIVAETAGNEVVSLARRRPPQSHAKLHAERGEAW